MAENLFTKMTDEENEIKTLQVELAKAYGKIKFLEDAQKKSKKSPEEKEYIILYDYADDSMFKICQGREDTYTMIKYLMLNNELEPDIHNSCVLVEGVLPENRISIYEFMKHMEQFFSDNFDIEDYNTGDDTDESEPSDTTDTSSINFRNNDAEVDEHETNSSPEILDENDI